MRLRKYKEINLVLSGGAAKGIAHIGVLKAINELGIKVRAVSGVSAGAIISVFYASGYSPEGMFSLLKQVNWFKLFKFKPPLKGLIGWEKAISFLEEVLPYRRLEKLEIPTYICATDLYSGKALYFSEGSLIPPLLGSCAIPGIFEPVAYDKYLLVDGGVVNNLPVEPFQGSDIPTVCVDVLPIEEEKNIKNILHILLRSFFLAVRSNSEKRREFCNLVIVPELENFSPLDVKKADQIMERGYRKALEILSE